MRYNQQLRKQPVVMAFCYAVICLFFILSAGCKKDDKDTAPPQGQYYFKAKFNGVQKDFFHSAQFQFGEKDGKLVSIIISGYEAKYDLSKPIEDRALNLQLEIFRYDMANISPGTYTEVGSTTSTYRVDGERHVQKRNAQGQLYTLQYDEGYLKDFTIVITEVSKEKGIKGTFRGRIRFETTPYDVINITEGEFYFPYNEELLNP